MSDRLSQLQSLLQRVRANAGRPRKAPAAVAPPPVSDTMLRAVPSAAEEEAEPVPLVRVAPAAFTASAPDPQHDAQETSFTPFSLTGEVSTLELVESEPPDALTEGDLVDMSSELLESLPPPAGGGWAAAAEPPSALDEEPPVSSQRPRLTPDLEASLEAARESTAPEGDGPLITPPPESGPQEAPPGGLFAAGVPDVETLIAEAPLLSTTPSLGPTPEQIGESVDLEEPRGPSLELDMANARPQSVAPDEELEALLGQPPTAGIYDESLQPPPGARDELVAHDRRFSPAATDSFDETPAFQSEAPAFPGDASQFHGETQAFPSEVQVAAYVPPSAAEATGMAAPEVFTPALASGGSPELRLPTPSFRPQTFVELLDASLALRG